MTRTVTRQQAVVTQPAGMERTWQYGLIVVLLWLAMLGVPWLALSWPGLLAGSWPWAAAPFGFQWVVLGHIVGTLGFNLWATSWLVRWFTSDRQVTWVLAASLLGVGALLVSALLMQQLQIYSSTLSFSKNDIVRLVWVLALQFPWAIGFWSWLPRSRWWFRPNRVDGLIACLVALLPALHAEQVRARHDVMVGEALVYNQYLDAWELGRRLVAMGVEKIQAVDAKALVNLQERRVALIRERVAEPLAPSATSEDRLNRARELFSLSEVSAAGQILDSLDPAIPAVALYRGLAAELERDWPKAALEYGRAIEVLRNRPADDDDTQRQLRAAHERYANNLRRAGEPLAAEAALKAGRRDWPQIENALLLQLAYHYQMAGRIWEAQDYFRQAAEADPSVQAEVDAQLKKLQLQAEGCVLRPTRGVSR